MAVKELMPKKRTILNAILCFDDANGKIQRLFESGYSPQGFSKQTKDRSLDYGS